MRVQHALIVLAVAGCALNQADQPPPDHGAGTMAQLQSYIPILLSLLVAAATLLLFWRQTGLGAPTLCWPLPADEQGSPAVPEGLQPASSAVSSCASLMCPDTPQLLPPPYCRSPASKDASNGAAAGVLVQHCQTSYLRRLILCE